MHYSFWEITNNWNTGASTQLTSAKNSWKLLMRSLKVFQNNLKQVIYFITSILKSLFILAIWLALSSAIYSQITLFFCSKSHLFLSQWEQDSKTKQPIRFEGFFKTNQLQENERENERENGHCLANLATFVVLVVLVSRLLCDFKTNIINWQLNFGSCNLSEIILVISNRNHAYDFWPNCTLLSSITIIYPPLDLVTETWKSFWSQNLISEVTKLT